MPFDSNGNFTRVHNWEEDKANNIDIMADRMDEECDDYANTFNNCLPRDGRVAMTGNLKMSNYQIKNLANGSTANDAVNKSQLDAVNTAVNTKQATITGGASTVTSSNLTANRALISNASGKIAVSGVSSAELGFLSGVTSALQAQLNGKLYVVSSNSNHIKFNNGFMIQWGVCAKGVYTVQLNPSFTSGNYGVSLTQAENSEHNVNPTVTDKTTSSFFCGNHSWPVSWIAVGF